MEQNESSKRSYLFSNVITVPNILTSMRIVLSLWLMKRIMIFGLSPMTMFGITSPFVLPTFAAIVVFTDTLDGLIARKFHCSSELGGCLDAIADKVFNWGIALSVVLSGVMPLSSLLLLTPTLARDVYVGIRSTKNKVEDGRKTVEKDEQLRNKDASIQSDVHRFLFYLRKGKGIPPTMVAKVKMWGMSIAMISGLCFGFSLDTSPIFLISSVVTDLLSLIDIPLFHHRLKGRGIHSQEEMHSAILGPIMEEQREKTFEKTKSISSHSHDVSKVADRSNEMEQGSSYYSEIDSHREKVLVKK